MAQARIGPDYGRAAVLTAESCKAQLRQWQSVAAEAGSSGKWRQQRLGDSGLRWEGECGVTK